LDEVRAAIGIDSIGPLDCWRGVIPNLPNVPFKYVHIVEVLRNVFRVPVYLLNDCTAAALGEWVFGSWQGIEEPHLHNTQLGRRWRRDRGLYPPNWKGWKRR